MEQESPTKTEVDPTADQEIREDQWKNCVGCIVGVVLLIVFLLTALVKCSTQI